MATSAYFHIPFCAHICHYCDFNKVFAAGQPIDDYLQAMDKEMEWTAAEFGSQLKTLFIGGGTPTVLEPVQLGRLLESIHKHFQFHPQTAEFTVEANPDGLTKEKLAILRDAGVNRLSIGVQAFDDELLQAIGRTHRRGDAERAVAMAREAGFENISLDLMYGLPGQTLEQFLADLETAFSLHVPHLSAYSLIIEPKTIFYNEWRNGRLRLPGEEAEAVMYEAAMERTVAHGYQQYEISNYAFPGFESQHNLVYWNNEEYYGIGAGAHSYIDGVRRANIGPIRHYIEKVERGEWPHRDVHRLTFREQMEEEMFLGLRKTEGVSKARFRQKFGREMSDMFGEAIRREIENGRLEETATHVRLTKRGKLLGNEVFAAFLGEM
ncbi:MULTISPECIES: radical SAM family heme chaperone HemW [Geobacillus]|jgi:putative oxygen-independent coproporphyrinogen III oxidase|uniref:Heme chaperone HemW n=1 Tax=Geobacillus thermodenitrificans (strain NG80-2) TaxID=420246 RepID=A4IR34_GEOTN|nr:MULTISPECIES: radical SAM family heme chaperone HemW [Geobacillus]ABO67788.1 Coproporphyrinogen III oxidase [Geobacillus thermodenitrificans NG80-2]ARP43537.1 Oxygen-independent coproporphyrinogen-III oxidase-like protein [Geobacillus thermodenitrificans]KQB92356.1 Oxygen-independent coproporphyrinogen-III oxidase-like protein YqeR [Geobacillus sp. PA-3]MED3717741.1 radical SAM family heme chaperone HemW [Geobacillus thermodenitrificans]MED4918603.1 radical SAM family heme chaperone HemW [G